MEMMYPHRFHLKVYLIPMVENPEALNEALQKAINGISEIQ
jgi:hypothetical protein